MSVILFSALLVLAVLCICVAVLGLVVCLKDLVRYLKEEKCDSES